tara:strand:+ start:2583 stop:3050 length:468 start_codon:yes stop_codon:yes gene_type:complete
MRTEGSVVIDRNIDDVFRLTNDHVADWSQVVVEDEVIDEQPGRVGTTFRSVTEEHGRQMQFQGTITQYDPPVASAVHLIGEMFDLDVQYQFVDLGEQRTKVTQRSYVAGKGMLKLVFLLCGWAMRGSSRKALNVELQGLKRFCEISANGTSPDRP